MEAEKCQVRRVNEYNVLGTCDYTTREISKHSTPPENDKEASPAFGLMLNPDNDKDEQNCMDWNPLLLNHTNHVLGEI